jgi:flagellar basal body-associated protein FliL
MNDSSDEWRNPMTLSRNTWIAIAVLMVVAAIVAIGLVASGGGGAGGAY